MRNNIIVNCESKLQHLLFHSFIFFHQICDNSLLCFIYHFSSSLTKCVTAKLFKGPLRIKQIYSLETAVVGLEVDWFEFHFSSFSGIVISLPAIPVHTISSRRVSTAMIEAVQVGIMTALVPPSPLVTCSTVTARPAVIVSIFGGERVASVNS